MLDSSWMSWAGERQLGEDAGDFLLDKRCGIGTDAMAALESEEEANVGAEGTGDETAITADIGRKCLR
jgi:hypothetical protein